MRWVAVAAAVLAACGARPPEPLPVVPPVARPAPTQTVLPISKQSDFVHVAPPPMTMAIPEPPDMSEEPRWPLSIMDHPKLEPHHDVAGVLAEPGVTWTELCARGVHKRRDPSHLDELQYLSAWCAAEHNDVRTAVSTLAPLLHSVVPEIASAVPIDLANIIVQSQDADHADQLLSDEGLRDPHLWDVLAASYFEVGKDADALHATSTALQLASGGPLAPTCHRLARELLLGSEALRELVRQQIDDPRNGWTTDATCVELRANLDCSQRHECEEYYVAKHIDPARVVLFGLHEKWNRLRDWSGWLDLAGTANHYASSDPVAVELSLQALDAALVSSNCGEKALNDIGRVAYAMSAGGAATAFKERSDLAFRFLHSMTDCSSFRDRWLAAHPQ
jgi:hypothetical protein